MANVQHSVQTVSDGIHVAKRWEHASAAARTGGSYTSVDEGGISHQTDNDTFWILTDSAGPTFVQILDGDLVGPGSSTDNAVIRFDGTDGKLAQNSGVTIDDSNNVSGVVNLTQTGYVEVADIAAPSNPGAGKGRLYKKTSDDGLFWLPDAAGPEVDLTGGGGTFPGSSTDNAVVRFDGTGGSTVQNSGVIVDDTNNVSGVVNLEQTGYLEFADMTAPANPSAGEGRLYKKTSDKGIHWKPDASGTEVDLMCHEYITPFSADFVNTTNWYSWGADATIINQWSGDYSSGPNWVNRTRGILFYRATELVSIEIGYHCSETAATNACTMGCWILTHTEDVASAPTGTSVFSTALSYSTRRATNWEQFTLSSTAIAAGESLWFAVKGNSATATNIWGNLIIRYRYT